MPEAPEPYEALWNRALWYLGRRDYGARELREKLLRLRPNKPMPEENDVDRAIERLLELDLLNDARYAQRLAEALSRKGYGARGIAYELKKRGLEEEAAPPVPDEERIGELLRLKYAAKLGDEKGRRTVFNALIRKGFNYADVKTAMRNVADAMRETMEDEVNGAF